MNKFVFLAFSFVWLIFMLYEWNLSRRLAKLRNELENLKAEIEQKTPSLSRSN